MKNLLILATMLLSFGFANAQAKIYNRAYAGDAIGRFEDGKIYNRAYGGDAIGRVEGGGQMAGAAAAYLLLF